MDEENRTHYDILGVSPDASSEDIDSAYVRVLQAHKPKMESDSQTKERVQEINEAYDAIGHEAARVVYDIKRLAPPGSTELPSKDEQQAASIPNWVLRLVSTSVLEYKMSCLVWG